MNNFFSEISNMIKARFKSYFWGTFILIWSLLNWKLIFIIFNFDQETPLKMKLEMIDSYIQNRDFVFKYLLPIAFTFISILFFLLFNHISMYIHKYFDDIVKTKINRSISGFKNIVNIDVHNRVANDLEQVTILLAEKTKELTELRLINEKLNIQLKEISNKN